MYRVKATTAGMVMIHHRQDVVVNLERKALHHQSPVAVVKHPMAVVAGLGQLVQAIPISDLVVAAATEVQGLRDWEVGLVRAVVRMANLRSSTCMEAPVVAAGRGEPTRMAEVE